MGQTRKSKESDWESESCCSSGWGNVETGGGILSKAKNREALGLCAAEIDLVESITRETCGDMSVFWRRWRGDRQRGVLGANLEAGVYSLFVDIWSIDSVYNLDISPLS